MKNKKGKGVDSIKIGVDTTKEVVSGITTATEVGSKAVIKIVPKVAMKLSLQASNKIAKIVPKVLQSFKVIGTAIKALGGFLSGVTGIVDLGLFIKEIVDDISSGKYGQVFWKTMSDKKEGLSKMVASLEVGFYINEILLEAEKSNSDWYQNPSKFLSETFGEEVSWDATQLDPIAWKKNFLEMRGGFLPAIPAIIASIASVIGTVGLAVSITVAVAGLIKNIVDETMFTARAPKMNTHEERMSALTLQKERLNNAIVDLKNMIELLEKGVDIDLSDKVQNSEVKNRLEYLNKGKELVEKGGVSYSEDLKRDIKKVEASTVGGRKTCDYKAESAMLLSNLFARGASQEEIYNEMIKLRDELKRRCDI